MKGLLSYDKYLLMFSGGKDSQACFLDLLDRGVPKSKIELWHHRIDGEGNGHFMDWPVTEAYCQAFADVFDVPLFFSWKLGGFEGEMLREDTPTQATKFEYPDDGLVECGLAGGAGPKGTRRKFPQVSADLSVRWCSAYLKISVADTAIRNQERFFGIRTLVVTGERAQESTARAKYKTFEPHRTDLRDSPKRPRHVDHWRPVHGWDEKAVWTILEKHRVVAHPAYYLGWGRLSCMKCIFGSDNQWASASRVDPAGTDRIAQYEQEFKVTIHRKNSVPVRIAKGAPYPMTEDLGARILAMSTTYATSNILDDNWKLPSGAFGESVGPT